MSEKTVNIDMPTGKLRARDELITVEAADTVTFTSNVPVNLDFRNTTVFGVRYQQLVSPNLSKTLSVVGGDGNYDYDVYQTDPNGEEAVHPRVYVRVILHGEVDPRHHGRTEDLPDKTRKAD